MMVNCMDFADYMETLKWKAKVKIRMRKPCKQPAVALLVTQMEQGGVEQIILDLYHGYKKRGYRAYIVCQNWHFDSCKEELEAPEDIYVFGSNLNSLINFLWRRDIRTVHYHYNVFGVETLHALGIQTIYTMHNVYTWLNDTEIQKRAITLGYMDYVVPVSEFVNDYFKKRTNYMGNNLLVINNGLNVAELDMTDGDLPVSRESLGVGEKDIVISFIASFYHVKYQIGMLGVMEKLVKKYPNVQLVILGGKGDINYRTAFMEELAKCSAKDNIKIAPFFEHKYIGRFLREVTDIFTLPTIQEGFGIASIEALYCGVPMVLTPTGAAKELSAVASCIIADAPYSDILALSPEVIKSDLAMRKHGLNEDSLVDCFSRIIEYLPEYKQKALECCKHANQFTSDVMVDKYAKLIRK